MRGEDVDSSFAEQLESLPNQISYLEFQELRDALASLPIEQREALTWLVRQDIRTKTQQNFATTPSGD